ncbi:iron-containing alcohol dehydrogenase [Lacticaseibacillus sp. GG6-2]
MVKVNVASGELIAALTAALEYAGCRRPLVVCDEAIKNRPEIVNWLRPYAQFSQFTPNPSDRQVIAGMAQFALGDCDGLVSLGGGSAIDVAKCIKAFQGVQQAPVVDQPLRQNALPHIAVPTTAGTGSEATPFAVVYRNGRKRSVQAPWLTPTVALLAPELLTTLPVYQRACGLLDALSQAIESFWSQAATAASQADSRQAITAIMRNYRDYMADDLQAQDAVMQAAHLAGQAIAITTTTGAHAMSYGLTHRYHIAHGHAVALCLPVVWRYMLEHPESWRHPRGEVYLADCFASLGIMLAGTPETGLTAYQNLVASLNLPKLDATPEAAAELAAAVNEQRLANNPATLTPATLTTLYQTILA